MGSPNPPSSQREVHTLSNTITSKKRAVSRRNTQSPPCSIVGESDSTSFAANSPKRADTGELYIVFVDFEALSTSSAGTMWTDNRVPKFEQIKALEPSGLHRVPVAIIESGVDMERLNFKTADGDERSRNVCGWADGINGNKGKRIGEPLGHGTHTASTVMNLLPNADLYYCLHHKDL